MWKENQKTTKSIRGCLPKFGRRLGASYSHFGSTSFVLPIQPKNSILNRDNRVLKYYSLKLPSLVGWNRVKVSLLLLHLCI